VAIAVFLSGGHVPVEPLCDRNRRGYGFNVLEKW
jgi:hypothetical protein